ncbi:MAG: transposase [Candidatus Thorarchaeota archaeon]|nr:transposase [Candidatus Thorarchaeota archaeon]
MVRSKGVIISVKVPINWEAMTERTRQRLRQTVGRDTRVIRAFLGIIEQYEDKLLTGRNRDRIDDGKLDQLTMTALKVKSGYQQRTSVPHDFKVRFPRISTNELTECRQTAVALSERYLKLKRKRGMKASRPTSINCTRRIPRWVFSQRFKLIERETSISRWWLDVRDSLDSVGEGRILHDHLRIPLRISPFHLNQIKLGELKALELFTDTKLKWWVAFAVRVGINDAHEEDHPAAILGIDLGIEKAVCSTLLTPEKTRETRYFVQKEKAKSIKKYDILVADLQREMHLRQNNGLDCDEVSKNLRRMRSKRENVAREYDHVLVRQLLDYISELSKKYTLYVAIGRLQNIRMLAKRGNYQGKRFRGMIHSWAFARITNSLKHGLAQLGWKVDGKDARFRDVPEAWTSIMCWKCGSKGKRPKQNYFHCPSCGHKTNADRSGSINIAARMLTLTKSLHSVRGLGLWTRALDKAQRVRPKAQWRISKKSAKGKSLLSKKEPSSGSRESAAVHHAQSSLLNFSDETGKGDNDPAVGRTVENLSVAGSDEPAQRQEKEARSVGGIPSQ